MLPRCLSTNGAVSNCGGNSKPLPPGSAHWDEAVTDVGPQCQARAGWHICFDVLDHLLSRTPIGRIVGREAMRFGWQRLHAEYAKGFGIETPNWPPPGSSK